MVVSLSIRAGVGGYIAGVGGYIMSNANWNCLFRGKSFAKTNGWGTNGHSLAKIIIIAATYINVKNGHTVKNTVILRSLG
jgi:hypothetical protein